MKAFKQILATLAVLATFTSATMAAGKGWETNIEAAVAKAKKENKAVMVEFTGSDWCPPCKMMNKKVFSKAEFVKKASKKYVLCVIDIPRGNKELYNKNSKVMKKYKVSGVPTVILMDDAGKEFTRFSASQFPSISAFVGHLNTSLEKKDLD
ncbi:MAG: thioredoxin family protein [Akkermansiaceae bacterium]